MGKSYWMANQTGNFSNSGDDTFDPTRNYLGVRLKQGVPLLDRDWNELEDLRRFQEMRLRQLYVGNGTADDGFEISSPDGTKSNLNISARSFVVDGFEVINWANTNTDALIAAGRANSFAIPASGAYQIYLDVWISEDPGPSNNQDVNEATSERHLVNWKIIITGDPTPSAGANHHYALLATVNYAAGKVTSVVDKRKKIIPLNSVDHLSISDLLVSGNVGIGTDAPENAEGWNKVLDMLGVNNAKLSIRTQTGGIDARVMANSGSIYGAPAGLVIGTKTNHPVSICTNSSLSVSITNGAVAIPTGTLNFGAQVRQMINLWNAEYGIGVQSWTQYYRADKNFAWYTGGSHNDAELNAGGGTTQMTLSGGNLSVTGSITAGNSDIYFTKTDHNHSGIGNALGYAAIENSSDYNCLMILGRDDNGIRKVGLWDAVTVNGNLSVTGNLTVGGLINNINISNLYNYVKLLYSKVFDATI
jgi:Family of unknown function (DUF6519)